MHTLSGLDGIAHRLDGGVADRMRGDLQARRRRAPHQLAKLLRRSPPDAAATARRNSLGASVDEDLDRSGPDHCAPESASQSQS